MKDYQVNDTRERVKELHEKGLMGYEIARELDITPTRVSQHLKILRESGALADSSAESA